MEEAKLNKLLELLEAWTRAEIIARYGPFKAKDTSFTNYAYLQIELEDEIRRLIFDTDDLIVLGLRWDLLKDQKVQTKEDLKQKFLKLQKQLDAALES